MYDIVGLLAILVVITLLMGIPVILMAFILERFERIFADRRRALSLQSSHVLGRTITGRRVR